METKKKWLGKEKWAVLADNYKIWSFGLFDQNINFSTTLDQKIKKIRLRQSNFETILIHISFF